MIKDYESKCEQFFKEIEQEKERECKKSFNQGRLEVLKDVKSFLEEPLVTMPAEEYLEYLKGSINDLIEESND